MVSTVENAELIAPKRTSPRSCQHDLRVREQCEALYKSGWMPAQISKQTDVPKGTIMQWAKRYHWTEKRDKLVLGTGKSVAATIAHEVERQSDKVRGLLAVEAERQAQALTLASRNDPAKFKTVVEACDKLFGWSKQEGTGCLIQIGMRAELMPKPA
jgi:transposase